MAPGGRAAMAAGKAGAKVQVRTPKAPGCTGSVDAAGCEAMRRALLALLPRRLLRWHRA
jgi:hypothetical protein